MLCLRQLAGKVQSGQLQKGAAALWSTPAIAQAFSQARPSTASQSDAAWKTLQEQGVEVNPCGSKFHPAVKLGLLPEPPEDEEVKSLQEAYAPWSTCFGCGAILYPRLRASNSITYIHCAKPGERVPHTVIEGDIPQH